MSKYLYCQKNLIIFLNYEYEPFHVFWWTFSWVLRWWINLYLLSHVSHLKGLSSEWTTLCTFNSLSWLNFFPQISHSYGLSFEWMRCSCTFIWPSWENLFKHNLHSNGLTLVWVLSCTFNSQYFELPNIYIWCLFQKCENYIEKLIKAIIYHL